MVGLQKGGAEVAKVSEQGVAAIGTATRALNQGVAELDGSVGKASAHVDEFGRKLADLAQTATTTTTRVGDAADLLQRRTEETAFVGSRTTEEVAAATRGLVEQTDRLAETGARVAKSLEEGAGLIQRRAVDVQSSGDLAEARLQGVIE
ncbi:MAG: hypothetical protein AAB223_01515, partial [Pseudomonadota bacterium]